MSSNIAPSCLACQCEPWRQKTYLRTCAPRENLDQTRRLIIIFSGRILDREGCKVSSCGKWRLWSDCADAQADLSLRWLDIFSGCDSFTIIMEVYTVIWLYFITMRMHLLFAYHFIVSWQHSRYMHLFKNYILLLHLFVLKLLCYLLVSAMFILSHASRV